MKAWLRRFRGFLIMLPLALAAGLGYECYQLWDRTDRAVDVSKGETEKLGPATIRLVGVTKKRPASEAMSMPPKGAVVVVAKFRGRIDDRQLAKKQKFIHCDSKVQNGDGWEWKSELLSPPYVPEKASKSCDGQTLDSDFNEVDPDEGEWYDFYIGYYVPKEKAYDLHPTLSFSKERQRYLRFES